MEEPKKRSMVSNIFGVIMFIMAAIFAIMAIKSC